MPSDHKHEWPLDCAGCGADAGEIIAGLEQQLAETREELRIALAQRQDYRANFTQAQALLEELVLDETERIGLYWDDSVGMTVCVYCESGNGHLPECPIIKARTFLADKGQAIDR